MDPSRGRPAAPSVLNIAPVVKKVPKAPDGGVSGWAVVGCAFTCNLILDGICNSYGELKEAVRKEYSGTSETWINLLGGLIIAMYLFIGPIAAALVKGFGARKVVILGSLITAAAFVISNWFSSFLIFLILYGILGGAGFGLIYLPSIVVVGQYFENKRAIATGITVAGSGVGTIVMPLLINKCIATYGLTYTLYILAALAGGCSFTAIAFRPLPMVEETDIELQPLNPQPEPVSDVPARPNAPETGSIAQLSKSRGMSGIGRKPTLTNAVSTALSTTNLSVAPRPNPVRLSLMDINQSFSALDEESGAAVQAFVNSEEGAREVSNPMNRKDILYQANIAHLPEYHQAHDNLQDYRQSMITISRAGLNRAGSLMGMATESTRCTFFPDSVRSALSEMVDLSLVTDFKHPAFLLLCISNLIGMAGFYIPFMFIKEMAIESKMEAGVAGLLVPFIGITNTAGRVFFGWFADLKIVSALFLNNVSLVVSGLLCILLAIYPTIPAFYIFCIAFGFVVSAYICLTSIVVVDIVKIDNLTQAMGMLTVFRGMACLFGSPMAAEVFVITGSYSWSFVTGGAMIAIAGLITFAIPLVDARFNHIRPSEEESMAKEEAVEAPVLPPRLPQLLEEPTDLQRTIQSLKNDHASLTGVFERRRNQSESEKRPSTEEEEEGEAE